MESKTPMKTRSKQALARRDGADGDQQPLEVFCRVKPVTVGTEIGLAAVGEDTIRLALPGRENEARDHKFTRVFNAQCDQKTVFDCVALPLVSDALKGKSGLLFTYGVTGSGKTFTMTGNPDDIGILPRCIDVVFNSISRCHAMRGVITYEGNNSFAIHSLADAMERKQNAMYGRIAKTPGGFRPIAPEEEYRIKDTTFLDMEKTNLVAVYASYVENHETKLFDLLDDKYADPIKRTFPIKKICDVPTSEHAYIKDLTEIEVRSAQDALDVLNMGQKRRTTAATVLNSLSSRGHAIFTLKFVHTPMANVDRPEADRNAYIVSQFSLVDLAGSERLARTGNEGKLRREANHINQSLMTLRTCLDIMRENQLYNANKPVPFREAKITQLFKGFFNGRGRVRVIVCVNPSVTDYEENIQVLRFAEDAQDVVTSKQEGLRFDLDAFKENVPVADEIAPASDFPITVDLRIPLFQMHGTRELPAVFDFDPSDMVADLHSAMWEHVKEELKKRAQVRATRAEIAAESLERAKAKSEKMLKDIGGYRNQLTEIKESNEDYRKEIDRLTHLLSATQTEKEQLRITTSRQERVQIDLANQLRTKEAEVAAERQNAERAKEQIKKETASVFQKRVAQFEMKAAEAQAKRERQLSKTAKRLSKINALTRNLDLSSSESDIMSACEVERRERAVNELRQQHQQQQQQQSRAEARAERDADAKATKQGQRGVPVVNPRHRRSLSEGNSKEKWLDHQPRNLVPLGTVMNPSGLDKVRRKSVTKLNKDDVAKCSRYSLTHQQEDSDGDLETHVYKRTGRTGRSDSNFLVQL